MAEITIEVEDDILEDVVRVEGQTDHRGSLNLGTNYGNQDVEVIIVEAGHSTTKESQTAD